ncbi:MAG: zinc-ribbon domain-containing protein, partial [Deltaproteobacteria bacterium]|nr:zinc-ribbon domain-containing protein [Deltaproteobacteria bacterium]
MLITCPQCNFSRDIPDQKVPYKPVRAICPKCHHRFELGGLSTQASEAPPTPGPIGGIESPFRSSEDLAGSSPGGQAVMSADMGTPWDQREKLGVILSIFLTIKQALFLPGSFFGRMKTNGDLGSPLGFAIIVGSISIIISLIVSALPIAY